jgi:hypothetical protein
MNLSPAEMRLQDAFERREPLVLFDEETIRADVIAQLVTIPFEGGLRRSLELTGAWITGDLDLSDCTVHVPLVLKDCRFDGEVLLNDARAVRIHLEDSEVRAFRAARLRCDGPLWLRDLREVTFVDLEDARIAGDLDLEGSRIHNDDNAVDLMGAQIDGDLFASRIDVAGKLFMAGAAVTGFFALDDAKLSNPGGMTVFAPGASIGLDVFAPSLHSDGQLHFSGARVGGDVQLSNATIKHPGKRALCLLHAEVRGTVYSCDGFSCDGTLDIRHSTISGQLRLARAKISHPESDVAIDLQWSEIAGGVEALESVEVTGFVNLVGTRIGGAFRFRGAELHGRGDCAINAFAATFGAGFRLERETSITKDISLAYCTISGDVMLDEIDGVAVDLVGCTISGDVSLTGAKLTNSGAKALGIANSDISGDVLLNSMRLVGGLRMTGNRVGGDLDLRSSSLAGPGRADHVGYLSNTTVEGGIWADKCFSCIGALRLVNVVVPYITFEGAELAAPGDIALDSSNLTVDNLVLADVKVEGGIAVKSSEIGHVLRLTSATVTGGARKKDLEETGMFSLDLVGTRLGRRLDLSGSEFKHKIILTDATVGDVRFDDAVLGGEYALDAARLKAGVFRLRPAETPRGSVHLANAHIDLLLDRPGGWPTNSEIDLAGFTYSRIGNEMTLEQRLDWLATATPQFMPGPYEQLATCLTTAGNDDDARTVRLAAVRRSYKQLGTQHPGTPSLRDRIGYVPRRVWGWLQDFFLGYGYRSTRAVGLFVLIWLAGAVAFKLGSGPCVRAGLAEPGPCPVKGDEHPMWDPFLYALDLLIPLIDLGHEKAWDVVGPSKLVMWVLMMSGWVLATAIIAAASRTLRRN